MKENNNLIFKIHYLNKLLDSNFSKLLEEKGLTPQQGRVLLFICNAYEKHNITQETIVKVFELSKSTVSGLVKRLVNNDLIELSTNKNSHVLKPTNKGLKLREYFKEQRNKILETLLNDFNEEQVIEINQQFDTLIENLRREK